jgi:hypothetical protein
MNRVILGLAFGIALCAPVAAAYQPFMQQDSKAKRVVAGVVNSSGAIVYGQGYFGSP